MIYTVTLNPAVDYVIEVPHFKEGSVNRTSREWKYPGGKGINVSRVLQRMGAPSRALGFVGGFTGGYVEKALAAEDITSSFIQVEGDTRINIKISGDTESEINGASPDISDRNRKELEEQLSGLTSDDSVVLAGSVPASLPKTIYKEMITLLKEREITCYLDTSGEALKEALKAGPDFVKPNHHELAELYDVEVETMEEAVHYGNKLREDFGVSHVVISMAGEGALYLHDGGRLIAKVPPRKPLNSVGAGDSLVAGFIYEHQKKGTPEDIISFAVATGSATAFSETFCTKEQVEELLKQMECTTV